METRKSSKARKIVHNSNRRELEKLKPQGRRWYQSFISYFTSLQATGRATTQRSRFSSPFTTGLAGLVWAAPRQTSIWESRGPSPQNEWLTVETTVSITANTELCYGKESRKTHEINTLFDLVTTQVSKLRGRSQNNATRRQNSYCNFAAVGDRGHETYLHTCHYREQELF